MTDNASPGTFSDIPLHLLRAEVRRRQNDPADNDTSAKPSCGSSTSSNNLNYNTPLHVFALFLILTLSTFACSFPLIARRFPTLPVPNYALFLSRHFGTGVLIATAFVHLLPTAYVNLTDPCLPRFWNEVYPPMAGFVAMVSVLVVVGVEMVFASKGAGHSHAMDFGQLGEEEEEGRGEMAVNRRMRAGRRGSGSWRPFRQEPFGIRYDDAEQAEYVQLSSPPRRSPYSDTPGSVDKPLPPPPPPQEDQDEEYQSPKMANDEDESDLDLDLDDLDPSTGEDDATIPLTSSTHHHRQEQQPAPKRKSSLISTTANGHTTQRPKPPTRNVSFASPVSTHFPSQPSPLPQEIQDQRLILQCLLLEAGILFHSVFIGMALSVTTGPAFLVLLIAISFHQTFEGLALGSRIAAIPSFSTDSLKPWLMCFMYGVTTPIGQAVGLAVHTLYDPQSEVGLLMVGIVNAVSAGLLLYAGLVQLLAEDFLSDRSYVELRGRRRIQAFGAVVGGCGCMALVGAFA